MKCDGRLADSEPDQEREALLVTQRPIWQCFEGEDAQRCGWMHPFEFGAAAFFQEHFDTCSKSLRFGGTSAGSCVASGLALGVPIDVIFEEAVKLYEPCKYHPFAMCDGVKKVMETVSPGDDAWRALSNRLVIGLSVMQFTGCSLGFTPELVTQFRDREHGIALIRASCHILIIGGFQGYRVAGHSIAAGYYDGGYANLFPAIACPMVKEGARVRRITIDGRPITGGIDIVPALGFTVPIMWSYQPRPPDVLRVIFRLGYLRTLEWVYAQPRLGAAFDHIMRGPLPDDAERRRRVAAAGEEVVLILALLLGVAKGSGMGRRLFSAPPGSAKQKLV